MKTYAVKEIFYTLQGEGAQAGRAAVFLRFSGCNLWSGREEDREKAICNFCDTDFVGVDGTYGGKYKSAQALAKKISDLWPDQGVAKPYVVCTGGEPLLQLDEELIREIKKFNFEIAIETNGTYNVPNGVDWVCLSPKPNTKILVKTGNELKFVFPQQNLLPEDFQYLDFQHFFIQPMDGINAIDNIQKAIRYCLENPKWRLSLQTHKQIGIR
ncbi:MAG: 7-carboxy-7-deazaguanine synthase [Saprospiraceae bacterium]|nr:7-carboxy-7-deazaguanine synthase [Candidatus Vicinibacter affinis]MBP6173832.1 7-carboxy-7-deazaguanine synthase [Saprospiraceae bacterium]MBK6822503.1 7-carboxy-7-deazaguanine synthase [Candidatus Vicinibacter affinis]MBK7301716.1 7-carboxy-7-deazaguanine synthase [Candidatus Vicinibacter affinis]MBK7692855.1 7-carboxy-7-deazaguanine synthase [Candidatus Vicinibacter affinis]